jgi:mRNA deadenylase 3'-5' endonuclease subunit Ccr4
VDLPSDEGAVVVGGASFTLMQWNVLFSKFASSSSDCCPVQFLDPVRRQHVILRYIERYSPDLMTLQELDSPGSALHDAFARGLLQLGYQGHVIGKRRTGRDSDAVGIIYKISCFVSEGTLPLKFFQSDDPALVMDNRVALVARLVHRNSGRSLVVATNHLAASELDEELRVAEILYP